METRFRIHGFHILDRLNAYLQVNYGIFELLVIGRIYPKYDGQEIELQAIFYDTKRKEFQAFNKRRHLLSKESSAEQLINMFLDDIYLNMVFSIETDDKFVDMDGIRLYTFRDILMQLYKNQRLPNPISDFKNEVRNYQELFSDGRSNTSVETKLKLESHSE